MKIERADADFVSVLFFQKNCSRIILLCVYYYIISYRRIYYRRIFDLTSCHEVK